MRFRPVRTRFDRATEITLGILFSRLPAGEEPELKKRPCTVAGGAAAEANRLLVALLRRCPVAQPALHPAHPSPGFYAQRIARNCTLARFLGVLEFLEFVKRAA